jgi:hypothetical protein
MVEKELPRFNQACGTVKIGRRIRGKTATRVLQLCPILSLDPARGSGATMMFLLRSAFWLCLVFSWMPLERSEIARVLADAKINLDSHLAAAAEAGCADSAVACGAVLLAADRALAPATPAAPEPSAAAPTKTAPEAPAKSAQKRTASRPSANSLTASDLAPAWRGRKAKSGA